MLEELKNEKLSKSKVIDINVLISGGYQLDSNLIQPATEDVKYDVAKEHSAEAIKNLDDIARISEYLINSGRYRDNMMFIVGINFGLRISDLRMLRFGNLINDNFMFNSQIPVFEQKTRNTRKRKMNRYITINKAVVDAVTLFLQHTPGVCLSDYMFKSMSNNSQDFNTPISVRSINRILKDIAKTLNINIRMSTHTFRKTFGYHQMMMSHNDSRKLLLLQKMFNHSSPAQTLDYIGITDEEIADAYTKLNLGSSTDNYFVNSNIIEHSNVV